MLTIYQTRVIARAKGGGIVFCFFFLSCVICPIVFSPGLLKQFVQGTSVVLHNNATVPPPPRGHPGPIKKIIIKHRKGSAVHFWAFAQFVFHKGVRSKMNVIRIFTFSPHPAPPHWPLLAATTGRQQCNRCHFL